MTVTHAEWTPAGAFSVPYLDPRHTSKPDFYGLCILGLLLVLDSWLPQSHLFFTLQSPQALAQHHPWAVPPPQPLDGQTHVGGGTGHVAKVGWLPALEELAV